MGLKRKKLQVANSKRRMLEELVKHDGIVSYAAKTARISRTDHYEWIRDDAEYAQAIENLKDLKIDVAEKALMKQIKGGIPQSTIFLLRTLGRHRVYNEKTELEHTGNVSLNIEFIEATPPPPEKRDEQDQ